MESLTTQINTANMRMTQLASQRSAADSTAIMGLTGTASRGSFATTGGVLGGVDASTITLQQLQGLSQPDLATLLSLHPEIVDRLLSDTDPNDAAAWWAGLSLDQQDVLALGAPALIGALNRLPVMVRVATNKVNAYRDLVALEHAQAEEKEQQEQAYDADSYGVMITPGMISFVDQDRIDYLQRVVDGDVAGVALVLPVLLGGCSENGLPSYETVSDEADAALQEV